jgi:nucleotide-binding universal stress UspA family protein
VLNKFRRHEQIGFLAPMTPSRLRSARACEALAPAHTLAERLGVTFDCHFRVGDPAEIIANLAQRTRCREIVMGTRGLGGVRGLLLGSVTTHLCSVRNWLISLL